jgi:hypothetical protein
MTAMSTHDDLIGRLHELHREMCDNADGMESGDAEAVRLAIEALTPRPEITQGEQDEVPLCPVCGVVLPCFVHWTHACRSCGGYGGHDAGCPGEGSLIENCGRCGHSEDEHFCDDAEEGGQPCHQLGCGCGQFLSADDARVQLTCAAPSPEGQDERERLRRRVAELEAQLAKLLEFGEAVERTAMASPPPPSSETATKEQS